MRPACHGYREQSAKIEAYIAQGMNREQMHAAFVKEFGGEDMLTAPIDRGFNRLAWFLPYAVGATGALAVGLVAMRWSRREAGRDGADAAPHPGNRVARTQDWTMSSATSIDDAGRGKGDGSARAAGHLQRLASLRPHVPAGGQRRGARRAPELS